MILYTDSTRWSPDSKPQHNGCACPHHSPALPQMTPMPARAFASSRPQSGKPWGGLEVGRERCSSLGRSQDRGEACARACARTGVYGRGSPYAQQGCAKTPGSPRVLTMAAQHRPPPRSRPALEPGLLVPLTPCQGIFQLLTSVSHTDLSPSLISNTPSSTVPTLQPEHLALHLLWCPGGSPCAGPLQLFPRFPGSLGERDSPIEWVTEQDLNSALETLRHWPRLAGKPSTA